MLVAEARRGQAELEPQVGEVITAQVPKFYPLQIIPDAFVKIRSGA